MARRRQLVRSAVSAAAAALLLWWPFAYRYTSFGLDCECAQGGGVEQTFWRLRWPGDGSVALAFLVEHRAADSGSLEPFDLGGSFLQAAAELRAEGFWQRHGFWWVRVNAATGPAPPIVAGADCALLVGVPHWLLVAVAALVAARLWLRASPPAGGP